MGDQSKIFQFLGEFMQVEPLESRFAFAAIGIAPEFGQSGTASIYIPGGAGIAASAATDKGDVYALAISARRQGERVLYRHLLYHLTAAGQFDRTFGQSGHVQIDAESESPPSDFVIAINPRGTQIIVGGGNTIAVLDRNGARSPTIETNLKAPFLNRHLLSVEALAIDGQGRFLVAGQYTGADGKQFFGICRSYSGGLRDRTFGDESMIGGGPLDGTPLSNRTVSRSVQIKVTPDYTIGLAQAFTTVTYDADSDIVRGSVGVVFSIIDPTGSFETPAWRITDSPLDSSSNMSAEVADLRVLYGNRFAVSARAGNRGGIAIVSSNGVLQSEQDAPTSFRFLTRLSPDAKLVQKPAALHSPFEQTERSATDAFDVGDDFFAISNNTVEAIGFNVIHGKPKLIAQRFDGRIGEERYVQPGEIRVVNHGTELRVEGTTGDDNVKLRYHAGGVIVRMNGVLTGRFAVGSFARVVINLGDGDDAISMHLAGQNRSVYLTGGNGDDRIFADEAAGELRGDDGADRVTIGRTLENLKAEGGLGNDTLVGTSGLNGGEGDDVLNGWPGKGLVVDLGQLWGGPGNDRLYAAPTGSDLNGDAGDDTLVGSPRTDFLDGGDGDDVAYAQSTDDGYLYHVEVRKRFVRRA